MDSRTARVDTIVIAGCLHAFDEVVAGLNLDRVDTPVASFLSVIDRTRPTSHKRICSAGNLVAPGANVAMALGTGSIIGGSGVRRPAANEAEPSFVARAQARLARQASIVSAINAFALNEIELHDARPTPSCDRHGPRATRRTRHRARSPSSTISANLRAAASLGRTENSPRPTCNTSSRSSMVKSGRNAPAACTRRTRSAIRGSSS